MTQSETQFVLLRHTTAKGAHYDFMLKYEGLLATWRLEIFSGEFLNTSCKGVRIFDHPLKFLTYEGPVQNNTGRVERIDSGICTIRSWNENRIVTELKGACFCGVLTLIKQQEQTWRITLSP